MQGLGAKVSQSPDRTGSDRIVDPGHRPAALFVCKEPGLLAAAPAQEKKGNTQPSFTRSLGFGFDHQPQTRVSGEGERRACPAGAKFGPPNWAKFGPPNWAKFGPPDWDKFGPPDWAKFGPPNEDKFGPPDWDSVARIGTNLARRIGPNSARRTGTNVARRIGTAWPELGQIWMGQVVEVAKWDGKV